MLVGPARFELTTSCAPCKRATKLRYGPTKVVRLYRVRRPVQWVTRRKFSGFGIEYAVTKTGPAWRGPVVLTHLCGFSGSLELLQDFLQLVDAGTDPFGIHLLAGLYGLDGALGCDALL